MNKKINRLAIRYSSVFVALLVFIGAGTSAYAQAAAAVPPVRNYIHIVSDLDATLRFYQALTGQQAGGSEPRLFAPNAPVEQMYNANNAEFRGATIRLGVSDLALEFLEWRGLSSDPQPVSTRIYDPGAVVLLLFVRDMNQAVQAVSANGGSIVSTGGQPVSAGPGKILLARDPDGFFVELLEFPREDADAAPANIISARLRITVTDVSESSRFYREAFGFEMPAAGDFDEDEVLGAVNNMGLATFRFVQSQVPASSLMLELGEYRLEGRNRVEQRLPAVGASMLRLLVADFDAALARAENAGAHAAPNNAEPVVFPNGRRMTVLSGPDGFLFQLVESAAR